MNMNALHHALLCNLYFQLSKNLMVDILTSKYNWAEYFTYVAIGIDTHQYFKFCT